MEETSQHGRATILVVDDEPHIRQVLALKLQSAGYEILLAEDGIIAMAMARQQPPRLVITDFRMPNMDGLQLCDALKSDEKTAKVPVILLTAYESEVLARPLGERNIRAMLSKPFSPSELLRVVQRTIAG